MVLPTSDGQLNHYAIINDCNDIIEIMASITIRKLEETTKRKLKIRAAMHGRSMEQEAREILKKALKGTSSKTGTSLAEAIQRRFAPFGGVDLETFPRGPIREPGFE
jgi:plasmid stability protein